MTSSRVRLRHVGAGIALGALALIMTACGITVPTDPDGTLDSVTGGVLHVGASTEPGLVDTQGAQPRGPLVELTQEFADSLGARIEWTVAGEETLVGDLEAGRIDMAIGGFTDATPWTEGAGVSRGYAEIEGARGRSLVFLVRLGENAFLSRLEAFLDQEIGS